MYFTIDRIVNGIAVLLDDEDNTCKVQVSAIPFSVEEGDLLVGDNTAAGVVITAKDAEELARRMEARRKRRRR